MHHVLTRGSRNSAYRRRYPAIAATTTETMRKENSVCNVFGVRTGRLRKVLPWNRFFPTSDDSSWSTLKGKCLPFADIFGWFVYTLVVWRSLTESRVQSNKNGSGESKFKFFSFLSLCSIWPTMPKSRTCCSTSCSTTSWTRSAAYWTHK